MDKHDLLDSLIKDVQSEPDGFQMMDNQTEALWKMLSQDSAIQDLIRCAYKEEPDAKSSNLLPIVMARMVLHGLISRRMSQRADVVALNDQWSTDAVDHPEGAE